MRIFGRMPQSLTETPGDKSDLGPYSLAGPPAMSIEIQPAADMPAGTPIRTEPRQTKVPYINERKKYELIIAASGQVVYDYDLSTGDIVWSGSLEQVLGYEREEMGGIEDWAEMIHPEDRTEALRLLEVAEKDRETYDVDYRFRHKNGSYRWLHDRGLFLIEDDRNVRRMIGIMQDIHDRKQAEILQNAVYRIAQAADTSAGLSDLFKSVHGIIGTVMPTGNFYIALYDREKDLISFPYFVDEADAPPAPVKPGKGLTEYVIRTGKSLLCDEAMDGILRGRGEVEVIGAPSAIWLGVPLIVDGKTIGTMVVQHYSDPNAYGAAEQRMFEFVSSQVARSIERKRAERALGQERDRIQKYLDIAEVLLLALDRQGTIIMINRKGANILGYQQAELVGKNWFDTCLQTGDKESVREVFKEIMAGRCEQHEYHENSVVMKSGEERHIAWHNAIVTDNTGRAQGSLSSGEDITEHRRDKNALADSEELHRRLVAAIPDMIIRTDLVGNIVFANDVAVRLTGNTGVESLVGRNIFSFIAPEDLGKAMQSSKIMFEKRLAPQEIGLVFKNGPSIKFEVDGAILRGTDEAPYGIVYLCRDITERKLAEASLREGLVKLRSTLKAAIDSLASAIEMRDPYTAGHQERVTRLARAIAEEMGLDKEQVEAIEIAGVIHDIGKLYVPAEILSKPTKLSDLEYSMIKMHAQVGFTILSKIDFPWPIAQIVHQHHEAINGSGYPQGLSGKDILLEAKILCVADVVEAMSSHRPYRPALGIQAALDEISQKRGILYDREVVDACLKLFRDKNFKFD
ncbi:MAG: PAS domain S-box protein [Acidobacteria bacterium]|nr:PAS domain S-box protein [Acidobacteriota bacterium]